VDIDWVIVGSLLAGIGSILSGVATYKIAQGMKSEPKADDTDRGGEHPGGS